ncbi:hypothetical protein [Mycobacterium holsaticum]|uniref:hypothetical protein n=1 Tax=Mycolicibacterium holsaticum TaxID=152142 RepID=UPI00197B91D3
MALAARLSAGLPYIQGVIGCRSADVRAVITAGFTGTRFRDVLVVVNVVFRLIVVTPDHTQVSTRPRHAQTASEK